MRPCQWLRNHWQQMIPSDVGLEFFALILFQSQISTGTHLPTDIPVCCGALHSGRSLGHSRLCRFHPLKIFGSSFFSLSCLWFYPAYLVFLSFVFQTYLLTLPAPSIHILFSLYLPFIPFYSILSIPRYLLSLFSGLMLLCLFPLYPQICLFDSHLIRNLKILNTALKFQVSAVQIFSSVCQTTCKKISSSRTAKPQNFLRGS